MKSRALAACAIGLGVLLAGARVGLAGQPAASGTSGSHRFEQHAVAADHPLASAAGAEILAKGGNAVDAAVATSFALSVVRPFSCGIGGGGFMVVYLREHPRMRISDQGLRAAINYRETAPAAITPDYFAKLEGDAAEIASSIGGKAVAVPGTVAGLLAALERFGTLERAAVLAPAIRLANEGFAADAAYVRAATGAIEKFTKDPAMQSRFAFAWERFLGRGKVATGDVIKLPEQAATLEAIAKDGATGFYRGPVAAAMLSAIRATGGEMTAEDLIAYAPADAEPLQFEFRGRTFLSMPPPSSGGLCMAETLGVLSRTPLDREVARGYSAGYLHLLVESFKHAFADRSRWLGDPAFVESPVARLLDPANLARMAGTIDIGRTTSAIELYGTEDPQNPAAPLPDDGGTSHLCVLDARGGAVACTETINLEFGSFVTSGGFCLNNQMDDFTTRPGKPNEFGLVQSEKNAPAAGKRPLSSMGPTIVLSTPGKADAEVPPGMKPPPREPRVMMIAGASGGPRIISATTQVILNVLLFEKPVAEAVAMPRVHHQWLPRTLEMERGFETQDVRWQGVRIGDWMRKQRHAVQMTSKHACVQAIVSPREGEIDAACDPRKGGAPAGR